MNTNQFLLSSQKKETESPHKKIKSFHLYIGTDFEYNAVSNQNVEIHLLGNIYDWEEPKLTNSKILEHLLKKSEQGINSLTNATNKYSGDYIFIIATNNEIFLFNDAAGQREIYYSDDFMHFGTQVKVLGNVCELHEHNADDAKQFYQSNYFKSHKIHVGDATHKRNVKHLLPNHIINITKKKVERIVFPKIKKRLPPEAAASKAAKMLRGYMKAISYRKKLLVGLTAGYDSRVLFAASLDIENCEYFVNQNNSMNDSHLDIVIAKRLVTIYGKSIKVNKKGDWHRINFHSSNSKQRYINSLDFPRFLNIANDTNVNEVIVNGNISEVGRNYFGSHKMINAKILSFLKGAPDFKFANKIYCQWLKKMKFIKKLGYNTLDLFYWEERMGIFQAKTRTEMFALGRNMVTPYNSRELLLLLLSTKRKYRDNVKSKLYELIIAELSDYNKELMQLPINPTKKNKGIMVLKQLKIYEPYRRVKVNLCYHNKCG